jgi:hypothetical protein
MAAIESRSLRTKAFPWRSAIPISRMALKIAAVAAGAVGMYGPPPDCKQNLHRGWFGLLKCIRQQDLCPFGK